jgi:hypothetical protein
MADEILLTTIKLDGAQEVQSQLEAIGRAGNEAFNRLTSALGSGFDKLDTTLKQVGSSLDKLSNTRIDLNTGPAADALVSISRSADQLTARIGDIGKPGTQSLQELNKAAQETQQQLEGIGDQGGRSLQDFQQKSRASETGLVSMGRSGVSAFLEIKNAIEQSKGSFDQLIDKIGQVIDKFGGLRAILAGLAVGGTLALIAKSANDAVSAFTKINDAAKASGLTLDEYQKLDFVLRSIGLTAEESAKKIQELGKTAQTAGQESVNVVSGGKTTSFQIPQQPKTPKDLASAEVPSSSIKELTIATVDANQKIDLLQRKIQDLGGTGQASFKILENEIGKIAPATSQVAQQIGDATQRAEAPLARIRELLRAFETTGNVRVLSSITDEISKLDAASRGGALSELQASIDRIRQTAIDTGNAVRNALQNFQQTPTTQNLIGLIDALKQVKSEAERISTLKLAGLDDTSINKINEAIKSGTPAIEKFESDFERLRTIFAENEEVAKGYIEAQKNLKQAIFEVGFAASQGQQGLGLMFAPVLTPVITGVADAIRDANLAIRDFQKSIQGDIGPAVTAFFDIFKSKEVDFSTTGVFSGFLQGLKFVVDTVKQLTVEAGTAIGELFGGRHNWYWRIWGIYYRIEDH